ncbi:hypothetical protein DFP72DRAFT_1070805 [Ephemerocybe angulata]|uniref:Uncharacterized protein n=1 Tax=Ephemerocybe angulata TaxID=980116 RepID=A0A8H6HS22_9AGAR|nr:hypothetical protein DFP72DRAFT_1070805 [Tulosesus angulatus]
MSPVPLLLPARNAPSLPPKSLFVSITVADMPRVISGMSAAKYCDVLIGGIGYNEVLLAAGGQRAPQDRRNFWDNWADDFIDLNGLPTIPPNMNRDAFIHQFREHIMAAALRKAMNPEPQPRYGPRMRDPIAYRENIRLLRIELRRLLFTSVNFERYLTRRSQLYPLTLFSTIFGPHVAVMPERAITWRRDSLQRLIVLDNVEDFEASARRGLHDEWLADFYTYWFERWPPPRTVLNQVGKSALESESLALSGSESTAPPVGNIED